MRTNILCCLSLLVPIAAFSQSSELVSSLNVPGVYGYSSKDADAISIEHNQASLAQIKSFSVGVNAERTFLMNDLGIYSLSAIFPVKEGSFGTIIDHAGNSAYSQSLFAFNYGRKFNEFINAGVQFNYYLINRKYFGNSSIINVDFSLLGHLTDQLTAGFQAHNLIPSNGLKSDERIPFQLSTGLGYDVSPELFFGCMIRKTENIPTELIPEIDYKINELLSARLGVQTGNAIYYGSVGIKLGQYKLEITSSVHPYLGITPGLVILYNPEIH
jgi:hypothetical protein